MKNWNKLLRPSNWNQVIGQANIVNTFPTMILRDNFPQFSIFEGPTGVGKSCIAELVAKSILCTGAEAPCNSCSNCRSANAGTSNNIIKYDMPNMDEASVESMIEMIFKVESTGTRVFIIEEAQVMDEKKIQPKWLEPLTKLQNNIYIIFCTTHLYQLIPQIRNRASIFHFETPTVSECLGMLENISTRLNITLPNQEILMHFIKINKNSPRGIISTLESFSSSNGMNEKELIEYFRLQNTGIYHRVLMGLLNSEMDLYEFVRLITGDEDVSITDITSGLKEYLMTVILEISLKSPQGILSEDRKEIQVMLETSGDKLLLKVFEFLGAITEEEMSQREAALFKLTHLKLKLSNMNAKAIVNSNIQNASVARMSSLEKSAIKERNTNEESSQKNKFVNSKDELLKLVGMI